MGTEVRNPNTPLSRKKTLSEILFEEGFRFEFFQAVRLLERIHRERKPVGRHLNPREEVVRFKAHVSMAFPASQIYEIEPEKTEEGEKTQPEMKVTFMGLAGALGALPNHYTQLMSDPSIRRQTAPLRDFLDLFNHRLISLFYRAWEKYRFPVAFERDREDSFSQYLYCLIGMGTDGLQGRLRIPDQILLYYAGLLAQRPRSAVALEGILQDYFDVPVEVVQFQGQWFHMNPESLTTLGEHGQNNELGRTAVLWERIWDPQARFRIRVGPLSYDRFNAFLPSGRAYLELVEMTRFFVGEEFNFEVQLILKREEVPRFTLAGSSGGRLGWSTWLKTREFELDPEEPVLELRVAQF